MLKKAVRQASKAASFQEASADLAELLRVPISPSHLGKLAGRVGAEWARAREADTQAFQAGALPCAYAEPPAAAAVMIDGGRLHTRAEGQPRGVHEKSWREYKAACCLSLSSPARAQDPQPEPPSKFLDQAGVARLAAEMKSRRQGGAGHRADEAARGGGRKGRPGPCARRRRRRAREKAPVKLVRTVLASMASSEEFGWQVGAEVHRRGLHRAGRKACVCDGQKYNWSIFEMHLVALGFVAVLDILHLLSYLHAAALAAGGAVAQAWERYQRWLRWAWSGEVDELLGEMRACSQALGQAPQGCGEDDPRRVLAEALTYVGNNRGRMDYPRYRRLGLPISSAPVESTIKQLNRRVKGTEKFWVSGGAEALLQLRAAHLSEDDSAGRFWDKPRPYQRAVGSGRLKRPS